MGSVKVAHVFLILPSPLLQSEAEFVLSTFASVAFAGPVPFLVFPYPPLPECIIEAFQFVSIGRRADSSDG